MTTAAPPAVVDSADFAGLDPTGKDDSAATLNAALAQLTPGQTLALRPGNYLLAQPVAVPTGRALAGSWRSPPIFPQWDASWPDPADGGTNLWLTWGKGQPDATPALDFAQNATLSGCVLEQPEQDPAHLEPYPWAVRLDGGAAAVRNCHFYNVWGAIHSVAGGTLVEDVWGWAVNGLWVDGCDLHGRACNVKWWGGWQIADDKLWQWLAANAVPFRFGRADSYTADDCFVISARTGFLFDSTALPYAPDPSGYDGNYADDGKGGSDPSRPKGPTVLMSKCHADGCTVGVQVNRIGYARCVLSEFFGGSSAVEVATQPGDGFLRISGGDLIGSDVDGHRSGLTLAAGDVRAYGTAFHGTGGPAIARTGGNLQKWGCTED